MIDRIINMVIRQVTRQIVGKGVNAAMKAGGKAMSNRGGRGKQAHVAPPRDQGFVEPRRKRHADERKGDEVLYPTDEYTDDMQPRR